MTDDTIFLDRTVEGSSLVVGRRLLLVERAVAVHTRIGSPRGVWHSSRKMTLFSWLCMSYLRKKEHEKISHIFKLLRRVKDEEID